MRKESATFKQIKNVLKMWTDIAKLHTKKMLYLYDLSNLTQTPSSSSFMLACVQAWEAVFFSLSHPLSF